MIQQNFSTEQFLNKTSFEVDEEVNIKWIKKNQRTKSYIWTARVLKEGHEDFCKFWLHKATVQLEDSAGNTSFVPFVPSHYPDLTVYEDVAQLMLNDNLGSQGARRKLHMVGTSQPTQTKVSKENKENDQNDGEEEEGGYTLLGPNDVSKTSLR